MSVTAAEALAHLRRAEARRAAAGSQRAARLLGLLPAAARLLRERYGVRRVVVFGSLVAGHATTESDVDLAVEGLRLGDYFEALADLMHLFGGPVDLVRLEDAPASLRDRVAQEGRAP